MVKYNIEQLRALEILDSEQLGAALIKALESLPREQWETLRNSIDAAHNGKRGADNGL